MADAFPQNGKDGGNDNAVQGLSQAESDPRTIGETLAQPKTTAPVSIGKYAIRQTLGRGGQATVFLAWDPDLSRHVVIKYYHSLETSEEIERVLQEGRALARIDSPFVARCHGAERFEGRPYLVLEYIRGMSLHDDRRQHRWPMPDSVRLVRQCVEGLCAIHARGMLHRDL